VEVLVRARGTAAKDAAGGVGVMDGLEQLHGGVAFEEITGLPEPVGAGPEEVAIDEGQLGVALGDKAEGEIEEVFLGEEDGLTADVVDVRIAPVESLNG
jgi:hypothetical protein